MSERQSSGTTDSTGFGWLVVALAGIAGIAIGLALGFALSRIAGSSIAELTTQRDSLAAENTALTAERDRFRGANATLTMEKNRTEQLLEQAKLQADSKSNDPQATEWKAWREIEKAYGPSSVFARFAQRLEATKWWDSAKHWTIRGNPASLLSEATRMCLTDPKNQQLGGELSVCTSEGGRKVPIPTLTFDLAAAWGFHVLHPGSQFQDVCEAIGRAMELSDQEIQRVRKVAGLIPSVTPRNVPLGIVEVANRLPARQRSEFSKKFDLLARYVKEDHYETLLNSDNSEPAINFHLSTRYVVNLCFGDYSKCKNGAPSAWTLTITENNDYSRDPAWVFISETEVDSMRDD